MSFKLNQTEVQPNEHVSAVMQRLDQFGRCMLQGERGTGKTSFLGPVLGAVGKNVFFIDGNEDAQSPELLESTRLGLEARYEAYKTGIYEKNMTVVIDHVPNLWHTGENEALNEQRVKLASSLADMMTENVAVLVVTDGRSPSISEGQEVPPEIVKLAESFSEESIYKYDNHLAAQQINPEEMSAKVRTLARVLGMPLGYVERLRSNDGDEYILRALELAEAN